MTNTAHGKAIDISKAQKVDRNIHTVTKDEFGNTGKVHCNGTEEVIVCGESDKGGRSDGALETTENENGRCVGDQESQETEKGWVGYKYQRRVSTTRLTDVPNLFARSPRGADGWKKRRSYCSGLRLTVI